MMSEIEYNLSTHWEEPWCMDRWEIINYIIKKYKFESYLEIGVSNPRWCFNMISCREKDGVDPGFEFENNVANYKMTSDLFFETISKDKKWDVIFIDGLHLAHQVIKDVYNSLEHLNDGGFIIMHDCSPPNVWRQRENYSIDGYNYPWNGTTWKSFYHLRTTRSDLSMCVVNTDYGIGIIRRGSQELVYNNNPFYDYNIFDSNRKQHLNLIECSELDNWLNKITT
jgi:hypothetical protein